VAGAIIGYCGQAIGVCQATGVCQAAERVPLMPCLIANYVFWLDLCYATSLLLLLGDCTTFITHKDRDIVAGEHERL
jgi:hypothetical protein